MKNSPNMRRTLILVLCLFSYGHNLLAQGILCPQDVLLWCSDDEDDIDEDDVAVGTGIYTNYPTAYTDIEDLDGCNVGDIFRTWFVDVNNNQSFDGNEPSCIQLIEMQEVSAPFNLSFPPNQTLSCTDPQNFGEPTWTAGPCDLIAYTLSTQTVTANGNGCYKILNEYTVINWCLYHPSDPLWNGEGIWQHTQSIKIIDFDGPEYSSCEDITIEVNADCQAEITVTNIATDSGACASDELFWTLSVDTWYNGDEDYFFGPDEVGLFKTDPIANGGTISITIPEIVGPSTHKIYWKVYDYCGNVRACNQTIHVVDNKAPTPYCYRTLHSNFENGNDPIALNVNMFDRGAFDNCSDVNLSFSENVNDTLFQFDCDHIGLNNLQVYVTDESGQSDYCDVHFFIADNGTCGVDLDVLGELRTPEGIEISGGAVSLFQDNEELMMELSDENGAFNLSSIGAFDDYIISPSLSVAPLEGVSTFDLVLIQKHILGEEILLDAYDYLAADINNDGQISALDLIELRKTLLGIYVDFPDNDSFFFVDPNQELMEDEVTMSIDKTIPLTDYDGFLEFVGVKLADVNESFELNLQSDKTEVRGTPEWLVLNEAKVGDLWNYSLAFAERQSIYGLQLGFDGMADGSIISGAFSLNDLNHHFIDGELRVLEVYPEEEQFEANEILFTITSSTPIDLRLSPNGFLSELYNDLSSFKSIELIRSSSDQEEFAQVELYPNPVTYILNIIGSDRWHGPLFIYNTQGLLVHEIKNIGSETSKEIDVSGLTNGLYLVKSKSGRILDRFVKLAP